MICEVSALRACNRARRSACRICKSSGVPGDSDKWATAVGRAFSFPLPFDNPRCACNASRALRGGRCGLGGRGESGAGEDAFRRGNWGDGLRLRGGGDADLLSLCTFSFCFPSRRCRVRRGERLFRVLGYVLPEGDHESSEDDRDARDRERPRR